MVPRSRAQLADLVHGLDLVEPGVVRTGEWRPGPEDSLRTNATCTGVGRIPADPAEHH